MNKMYEDINSLPNINLPPPPLTTDQRYIQCEEFTKANPSLQPDEKPCMGKKAIKFGKLKGNNSI